MVAGGNGCLDGPAEESRNLQQAKGCSKSGSAGWSEGCQYTLEALPVLWQKMLWNLMQLMSCVKIIEIWIDVRPVRAFCS